MGIAKVSIQTLRTFVKNGWTIANRRAITSQIGKSNFDEITNLARKQGMTGDVFDYQMVKDQFTSNNLTTLKRSIAGEVPKNEGTAFKRVNTNGKIEKQPISVKIMPIRENEEWVTYNFFDGNIPIGFVQLEEHFNIGKELRPRVGLFKDYPEYGIQGNRVIVHMLQNYNEKVYAGIGNLADRVAVQHCLNHGIEPNILSEASYQSHLAHFLRGKRFLPYKGEDYNKIFEQLAKIHTTGVRIDTSQCGSLFTYMPREMVEQIKTEVANTPLFTFKI